MSKRIPLGEGHSALVDDADYEFLMQWSWHVRQTEQHGCSDGRLGKPYAARGLRAQRRTFTILMHRALVAAPKGLLVDHINGDSLDNRKGNLRICTTSQNAANVPIRAGKYRGVDVLGSRFRARIQIEGRLRHLGQFSTAEEAARCYDAAALKHFGEFAHLNFRSAA